MRVRPAPAALRTFGRRLLNRGLIFQFTVEYHCPVGIVLLNGDIQLCLSRAGDGIAGVLQPFHGHKIGIPSGTRRLRSLFCAVAVFARRYSPATACC